MFNQVFGTAIRTACTPPYACLAIGYQEGTKLFTQKLLPEYFSIEECELMKKVFKRYMDYVFFVCFFWPKHLDFEYFSTCLKSLHPAIKYTLEKTKLIQIDHSQPDQVLNFLEIEVILNSAKTIETDVYYKDKIEHDNLPYNVAHPKHCKDNLPCNLPKRVIDFASNGEKVEMRLK